MKRFLKLMALCLALLMVCASFAACSNSGSNGSDSDASAAEGAIKIGGIGPITGPAAAYGQGVKNAAELAVEEINAKGGTQLAFNFQDDEHDAEKAVNAYNNLKDWGMQILMGTVTSTPCIAVAENAKDDNMFLLTPSGTSVDCVKYDNAFRMCFSDPNQGVESAKYIANNNLAKKVAVIYDSSDPYSSGIYDAFKAEAENQGLELVAAEAFTSDSKTDFSVQIQKIQKAGAELVFLPIYYTEASLILTQCNKVGFSPIFFGADGLDGLLDKVENFDVSLAEGAMFLTPFSATSTDEKTKAFVDAYKAKFDDTPNQFAADAYDAIYVIYDCIEKQGITADMSTSDICEALKTAMTSITFEGITATSTGITWSADGEPNKDPLVVKIVNGAYEIQ